MKLKGSLQQAGNSVTFNDGATSAAVLQTTNSAAATFSLPSSTDTLVGRASVDTLTNKTIDAGSNTLTGIANAAISGTAAIAYSKLTLTGSVVNADISASAAIAYTKLALTGSLVNADVSASAAIAYSKLNLAGSVVNADIATGAAIAYAKLALTGAVVNADISSSAAIAYSKLALTGSVVAADLASGFLLASPKGGTGVNNTGTLTYGANNITLTTAGVTSVTLPTTGTLATLAGAETLTNKTLTAPVISSITNVGTLTLPSGPDTLVGTSASQTLSNKQIGSGNSVSGASASSFNNAGANILLPSTADTLVGRATTDTLTNKTLTAPVISTISNSGTLTLPTGPDTLVGRATTDTLTNKTLTTPTLNTPLLGTYLDYTETTTPANPGSGKLRAYAKSDDKLYLLNSSGVETAVGAGAGEKNYVTGTSTASGWNASGAGITVGTTTSGLPRPNTTATGILLTGVSGSTAYAYFRFILDDADAGKKLKFQFDMKPGTAVASDFKVDVYSNTAVDYTTGNTRLALSTDSSSVSALPALTGTYRTTFDAPAITAKWIEVRVGLNQANVHTLVVSDVVVGPGVVTQGAAITEWQSYPIVVGAITTAPTKGTVATDLAVWRRVGSSLELHYEYIHTAPGTTGSGNYLYSIPAGLTINSAVLPSNTNQDNAVVGVCKFDGSGENFGYVHAYDSTHLMLRASAATFSSGLASANYSSTNLRVTIDARIPITEYAGSGTVNVAQNDVEFASNSNTANADDTVSFAYGPAGSQFAAFTTSTHTRRVAFPTPIQPTDLLSLEIYNSRTGWMPLLSQQTMTCPAMVQGANTYGIGFALAAGVSNAVDVTFYVYRYPSSSTSYAAAGLPWTDISANSQYMWRLRKMKAGQAVGFGIVQPGVSSGLVSASGVPGNSGTTVATSYVGEVINFTARSISAVTTGWTANASALATLTTGTWAVYPVANQGNVASLTGFQSMVSTNSANDSTGNIGTATVTPGSSALGYVVPMIATYYQVTTSTPIYAKAGSFGANATIAIQGFAVRIA